MLDRGSALWQCCEPCGKRARWEGAQVPAMFEEHLPILEAIARREPDSPGWAIEFHIMLIHARVHADLPSVG